MRVHHVTPISRWRTAPAARAGGLVLASVLAACGPQAAPERGKAASPPPRTSGAAGYVSPPELEQASRTPAGLVLAGHAPAGATVNLASPEGLRLSVKAGADGRWSLTAPADPAPDMFALSAVAAGRALRAEGAVLALPAPGPAALLVRPGFAALPIGHAEAAPTIAAVDYDRGGGVAVSGLARPMARVRLSIDGAAAGLSQADEVGAFGVLNAAANRPLSPGVHQVAIDTDPGHAEAMVRLSLPAPLGQAAYRATRQPDGWRIDWTPAGGGVQTTVVFDAPPPAGAPS